MTEWRPPKTPSPAGYEYVTSLLVLSTPDGLTSRWEDGEPSTEVRSEVAGFARQMSEHGAANMRRIDPPEEIRRLLEKGRYDEVPLDELCAAEAAECVPPEGRDGSVFLRLNVRAGTPAQAARWGHERAIDFEFGPMGAPAEYPRMSVDELFRYAATTA